MSGVLLSLLIGLVFVIIASMLPEETYVRIACGWFGYGLMSGGIIWLVFR